MQEERTRIVLTIENGYVIVTDSTADLTQTIVQDLGILVLPMEYILDGTVCHYAPTDDESDITAFYQALKGGKMAQTSQVSPMTYYAYFRPILERGQDILYIAFSSGLSATYETACQVIAELQKEFPQRRILAVDSLCASAGEGLLVYAAAQKQKQGLDMETLYQWLLQNRLHLCHWFTVDDLAFLKRGGRISASTAMVGDILQIKPVMHVDDAGHLVPVSKAHGRKKSLHALAQAMQKSCIPAENEVIFIGHGNSVEDATLLKKLIATSFPQFFVQIVPIGPIIGAHAGPGVIALFFFGSPR